MGRAERSGGSPILYQLYDATYLAMTPARLGATAAKLIFSNPFSPFSYTLAGRMAHAGASVFEGVAKRHKKSAWRLAVEPEIVLARPFCNLLRFTQDPAREVPRILLVAPLSGHHATLLRDTVRALIGEHDVYVTDWLDAREVPAAAGRFDLDAYIGYLLEQMRFLGPNLNVVAVCQPAPAVLAAVSLLAAHGDAAQPRTMTLMGGPIDPRANPTAPTEFAASHSLDWISNNVLATVPAWYPGAGRRVYPGFLQLAAFLSMNPDRHMNAHHKMFDELVRGDGESAAARRRFYDEYLAVMDMPAEYYLDTVENVFQKYSLPNGTMTWRGERVDPAAIRETALFTVEGELDDISAPGQTYAAHALCSNIPADRHDHMLELGVGHYGIFNGRRWRADIMPRIAQFIRLHGAVAAV